MGALLPIIDLPNLGMMVGSESADGIIRYNQYRLSASQRFEYRYPATAVRVKPVYITTLYAYTLYYYPRQGHPRQDLSICVPIHGYPRDRVTARQDWPRHGHSRHC